MSQLRPPTGSKVGLASISVVIPTYERCATVCDAIAALARSQYDGSLEAIVVDDGSTDGTAAALGALECPFPLRIIRQANAGAAAARNRGAREATGDILLFLDDDMIARPDLVEQHALSHASGAEAVLGHIPLDPASPKNLLAAAIGRWAELRRRELGCREPTVRDFLSGHFSVRREVFQALGGFDEAFTAGGTYGNEDLDFGLRLLERHTLAFNADAVAHQQYVVRPEQHLRQYFEVGRADVAFARKHPLRANELFNDRGARTWRARLLLRPLANFGWIVKLARVAAVSLASQDRPLAGASRGLATRLFFQLRDLVYWSGVQAGGGIPRSRRVLILCYHALLDLTDDPVLAEYGIAPATFAAQLDRLSARGFAFVSPDELSAVIGGQGRVPAKAVLLTFDDCYSELVDAARSILIPRAVHALAFAVSGMASGTNEWDNQAGSRSLQLLDSSGLVQLRESGVEIGCHSRMHRALPGLADDELDSETSGAASDLAALGLPRPRFFAYPFGRCDARSRAAVARAGFVAGFGLRSGRAGADSDRFDLPRVEILASDSGWRFRFKMACPKAAPLLRWPRRALALCRGALRRVRRLASSPPVDGQLPRG